ncbi:MAG: hypothetical protein PHR66_09035 [Desulfuromonadaceae bacterium]|nr:hypothetical protein [Desulfuromonadaceae bacterium]
MTHDIWSVILIAGLIGWLFSIVMLMLEAFPKRNVFLVPAGIRWGAAAAVSFFIWVVGMLNA